MKRVYIGNKELTALGVGGGGDDTQKWLDYFNGTLTEFTVPEGVTSINPSTFVSCTGLTSLTLPSSITSIEKAEIHGKTNPFGTLKTMTVKATTPPTLPDYNIPIPTTIETIYVPKYSANIYKAIDGWNGYADKIQALPQNETVVTYNDGTSKEFDIKGGITKDKIENITAATKVVIGDDVTSIDTFGFMYCGNITDISLSDSVTILNISAFAHTGIKTITIPNSVTKIDQNAFGYCTNLSSVIIKNSSSKLAYNSDAFSNISSSAKLYVPSNLLSDYQADSKWTGAFKGGIYAVENIMKVTYTDDTEKTFNGSTAIKSDTDSNKKNAKNVVIYDTVLLINKDAFKGCSGLTSVVIPDSVTNIGNYAFNKCTGLTSVVIPNSVTKIGNYAFSYCSGLTSVVIPDSVASLGDYAFYKCSGLSSITIPDSVTNIGLMAFDSCSGLTSVTISEGVETIGIQAFCNCSSIASIEIPASVTNISTSAFLYSSALTSVTIKNSTKKLTYSDQAFDVLAKDPTKKLYVPSNLLSDYQADSKWTGAFKGGIYPIQ